MASPTKMASPSSSCFLLTVSLAILLAVIVGKLRQSPDAIAERLVRLDAPVADIRTDHHAIARMSTDYGLLTRAPPAAVLHPSSPADVAALVRLSHALPHPFPVSARGNGQSIRGQTLAPGGVVVDMLSLQERARYKRINVSASSSGAFGRYVDAGAEQLWIDVLRESLVHGLAPRSWTDYLYMSVGGTLSNAGISGQAFRSGPQISNVYELDVITGKGEMVTCSHTENSELFYGVLGGLGQLGIITRARIPVVPAPVKVRWLRLIYSDFAAFTRDEELLIGMEHNGFDYVEGLLLLDHTLIENWKSSFFSDSDMENIGKLAKDSGSIYCLEGAVYYYESDTASSVDKELEALLKKLSFAPGFAFSNDVTYTQFLDRVHDDEESTLRSLGLWEVPHPWINIFVPKSRIHELEAGVFRGILKDSKFMGPLLVYPMNKNKWDERMSVVLPDEDVFYTVELLRYADVDDWETMDEQNNEILRFCDQHGIKYKQYLPYYTAQEDWAKHYGPKWDKFVQLKKKYDPKAILSPGQKIFTSSLLERDDASE